MFAYWASAQAQSFIFKTAAHRSRRENPWPYYFLDFSYMALTDIRTVCEENVLLSE
jgi:hypothetical protein